MQINIHRTQSNLTKAASPIQITKYQNRNPPPPQTHGLITMNPWLPPTQSPQKQSNLHHHKTFTIATPAVPSAREIPSRYCQVFCNFASVKPAAQPCPRCLHQRRDPLRQVQASTLALPWCPVRRRCSFDPTAKPAFHLAPAIPQIPSRRKPKATQTRASPPHQFTAVAAHRRASLRRYP
ncbi:hypothetical protein M0R45_001999 [Rubus argutus]|uniref:Uncharacterized protein n=1 Tax=Rubus argutus TaxID=59490 RepID=A0AAW1VEJ1_RUBAR